MEEMSLSMLYTESGIREMLGSIQSPEQTSVKLGRYEKRYIVYRMLQALYQRQISNSTGNGDVGFTVADARILGGIASRSRGYGNLTPRQALLVVRLLVKYSGQLAYIASQHVRAPKAQSGDGNVSGVAPGGNNTESSEDFNRQWVEYKNEFAELERKQEAAAYLSEMKCEQSPDEEEKT